MNTLLMAARAMTELGNRNQVASVLVSMLGTEKEDSITNDDLGEGLPNPEKKSPPQTSPVNRPEGCLDYESPYAPHAFHESAEVTPDGFDMIGRKR